MDSKECIAELIVEWFDSLPSDKINAPVVCFSADEVITIKTMVDDIRNKTATGQRYLNILERAVNLNSVLTILEGPKLG